MPLLDHVRELRNRVFKMLLAVAVGAVLGWIVYPHVWHFIEAPYCRLHLHSELTHGQNCSLYVTGLFDSLFLRLKISLITGVIVSSPVWMYQLWAFIAPGLYHRERRWAYLFAGSSIPLFALGGAIAYFAMTKGLRFLIEMVPNNVVPIITINTYLGYAIAMLLIFGLAFELPLVLTLLNMAGVMPHRLFRKWRRMIIFVVFLFAAVFTPSPDPISMLLLAVPCVALVEIAELLAWMNDRRRANRDSPYPGISPDELMPLDLDEDSRDGVDAGRPGGQG
ncbi:MAG TPA: twin-arginine translocase subunit TatC [Streptosporangiaceae bacterium]